MSKAKPRIAIIGLGREGLSTLKFLRRNPDIKLRELGNIRPRRAEIWILDRNLKLSLPRGIKSRLGQNYLDDLKNFDVVVRSPGIPWTAPEIRKAARSGTLVTSLTRIFFELCPCPIVGVTGTKGKTTTATLIYEIMRRARKNVFLTGNIGSPSLDLMPRLSKKSLVIDELSSFQLQDLEKSPGTAVIVEMFPDHQDAHKSAKEYYDAKKNIVAHQKRGDAVFYFSFNPQTKKTAEAGLGRKMAVPAKECPLFRPEELKLRGAHMYRNAVMAAEVARHLGASDEIIRRTIKNFRGVPNRLEFIRKINGVSFFNDSAATNPDTTAAAAISFQGTPNVLIAGGYDKGLPYRPLAIALRASSTKEVILIGANKEKIHAAIKNTGIKITRAGSFSAAIQAAYRAARRMAKADGEAAVVLSPGAASFDMFRNYADRGARFIEVVRGLK